MPKHKDEKKEFVPYTPSGTKSTNDSSDDSFQSLLREHNTLLAAYNEQEVQQKKLKLQNEDLRKQVEDFKALKNEMENFRIRCHVCQVMISRKDALHIGTCGHGACRPCFVNSVAHSAVQTRQHLQIESVREQWRCFTCRIESVRFVQWEEDRLVARLVTKPSDVRDEVLQLYQELVTTLNLPPVTEDPDMLAQLQEVLEADYFHRDQPLEQGEEPDSEAEGAE